MFQVQCKNILGRWAAALSDSGRCEFLTLEEARRIQWHNSYRILDLGTLKVWPAGKEDSPPENPHRNCQYDSPPTKPIDEMNLFEVLAETKRQAHAYHNGTLNHCLEVLDKMVSVKQITYQQNPISRKQIKALTVFLKEIQESE